MPATLVSFLGTGRRERPDARRSGYVKTTYVFPETPGEPPFEDRTSLFGAALLRYLRNRRRMPVKRWIVLGTSASLWSDLTEALNDPGALADEWVSIDEKVVARSIQQSDLDAWQQRLNAVADGLDCRLCRVGEALDPVSQQQVCRALFDNIPPGDDVVFDISHGFRHQPVIAGFVISLMRWTHGIRRVSFYSGVLEAGDRDRNRAPVIELPICQELIEGTESAAVLELTGNYTPLASTLGLPGELAWFLENTNQLPQAKRPATELLRALPSPPETEADVVREPLAALLRDRLNWAVKANIADRYRANAEHALVHGDYFRAVVLAFEALLVRAILELLPGRDPMNYDVRSQAADMVWGRLLGDDRELFKRLQWTRNACAHGCRSGEAPAQRILSNPAEFSGLIRDAMGLFDRWTDVLNPGGRP